MKSNQGVIVTGDAERRNIIRTCAKCGKKFLMTCEDYIFDKCGVMFKNSEEKDDWVCEECYQNIMEIKNL